MEIDYNEQHWEQKSCPKYDCRKDSCNKCKCGLRFVDIPANLGDDSAGSSVAPKNGAYCNAIVKYEANGHVYIYSSEGVPVMTEPGNQAIWDAIKKAQGDIVELDQDLAKELVDRAAADKVLQDEIDELKNNPDVVDIVNTYADLQDYDTQHLTNNDIIRVLNDETHDGYSTYYRYNKQSDSWTYVGKVDAFVFEEFTFTLVDGTTITKEFAVYSQGV